MVQVRGARVGEAGRLTALCIRSKAHWGYDARFMRQSRASLRVSSTDIALGRVLVAVDGKDRPIGVASLIPENETTIDLALFFVEPEYIGRGVGRVLFKAAVTAAVSLQARVMTILADPHATTFYDRMGAHFLRNAPSDAIPGRALPLYEYDLTSESRTE